MIIIIIVIWVVCSRSLRERAESRPRRRPSPRQPPLDQTRLDQTRLDQTTLHYTTLHYTTIHYTPLHYTIYIYIYTIIYVIYIYIYIFYFFIVYQNTTLAQELLDYLRSLPDDVVQDYMDEASLQICQICLCFICVVQTNKTGVCIRKQHTNSQFSCLKQKNTSRIAHGYGKFSNFQICFCGLDSGDLKFETVRTHNKQRICFPDLRRSI